LGRDVNTLPVTSNTWVSGLTSVRMRQQTW
jgi:hypothetical protein